jgi:hypothetical protein
VHTQINLSTLEEVLFFLAQQQQPKSGKVRAADGSKVPYVLDGVRKERRCRRFRRSCW